MLMLAQVELYKEIKKSGSSRSVRAALARFSALAPHIRPAKVGRQGCWKFAS